METNWKAASLVTIALSVASMSARGQLQDEFSVNTLKGLTGVTVTIEMSIDKADELNLFASDLQTDAELKLRLAGVPVHRILGISDGKLVVRVIAANEPRSRPPFYGGTIAVALQQTVALFRQSNPMEFPMADTWSTYVALVCSDNSLRNLVGETVKDKVDEFINAYLSVNPKH